MFYGRSVEMWLNPRLGLGRLFVCDLLSGVDGSRCGQSYLLRVPGVLAPVLGLCVLRRGLLLHVLSV